MLLKVCAITCKARRRVACFRPAICRQDRFVTLTVQGKQVLSETRMRFRLMISSMSNLAPSTLPTLPNNGAGIIRTHCVSPNPTVCGRSYALMWASGPVMLLWTCDPRPSQGLESQARPRIITLLVRTTMQKSCR